MSSDFYQPTDADMLRLENELLAFEVTFLRARQSSEQRVTTQTASTKLAYNELEDYARGLRDKVQTLEEYGTGLKAKLREVETYASGLREEVLELRRAQSDLRRVLKALRRTGVGPVLRISKRYREIERRNASTAASGS